MNPRFLKTPKITRRCAITIKEQAGITKTNRKPWLKKPEANPRDTGDLKAGRWHREMSINHAHLAKMHDNILNPDNYDDELSHDGMIGFLCARWRRYQLIT